MIHKKPYLAMLAYGFVMSVAFLVFKAKGSYWFLAVTNLWWLSTRLQHWFENPPSAGSLAATLFIKTVVTLGFIGGLLWWGVMDVFGFILGLSSLFVGLLFRARQS
jgi:hypothetical protein